MVTNPIDHPPASDNEAAVSHVLGIHSMINNRLDSIEVETPPFYTTRPLFRAFFIAIPGRNWDGCTALVHIASLKVLIVLTGEAVFGLQPDPVAASGGMRPFIQEPSYDWLQELAKRFRWKGGKIVGPSSRWVDMNMYIAWTGFGAQVDAVMMNNRERVIWNWHWRNCTCEKMWVFVDQNTST